jgi:hypothetical protein
VQYDGDHGAPPQHLEIAGIDWSVIFGDHDYTVHVFSKHVDGGKPRKFLTQVSDYKADDNNRELLCIELGRGGRSITRGQELKTTVRFYPAKRE